MAVYRLAVAEATPDVAPTPGGNGCTTGLYRPATSRLYLPLGSVFSFPEQMREKCI